MRFRRSVLPPLGRLADEIFSKPLDKEETDKVGTGGKVGKVDEVDKQETDKRETGTVGEVDEEHSSRCKLKAKLTKER